MTLHGREDKTNLVITIRRSNKNAILFMRHGHGHTSRRLDPDSVPADSDEPSCLPKDFTSPNRPRTNTTSESVVLVLARLGVRSSTAENLKMTTRAGESLPLNPWVLTLGSL